MAHTHVKHLFHLLLTLVLSSCSERPAPSTDSAAPSDPFSEYAFITLSVDANATNDFQRAIATNDTRFVAYKYRVPRLPSPGLATPIAMTADTDRYGIKIIAGTGDDGPKGFPADLAKKYAVAYNTLLLEHLKAGRSK